MAFFFDPVGKEKESQNKTKWRAVCARRALGFLPAGGKGVEEIVSGVVCCFLFVFITREREKVVFCNSDYLTFREDDMISVPGRFRK